MKDYFDLTLRVQGFYSDLHKSTQKRYNILTSGRAFGPTAKPLSQLAKRESDKAKQLADSDDLALMIYHLDEANQLVNGDFFTAVLATELAPVKTHRQNRHEINQLRQKIESIMTSQDLEAARKDKDLAPPKDLGSPLIRPQDTVTRLGVETYTLELLLSHKKGMLHQAKAHMSASTLLQAIPALHLTGDVLDKKDEKDEKHADKKDVQWAQPTSNGLHLSPRVNNELNKLSKLAQKASQPVQVQSSDSVQVLSDELFNSDLTETKQKRSPTKKLQ